MLHLSRYQCFDLLFQIGDELGRCAFVGPDVIALDDFPWFTLTPTPDKGNYVIFLTTSGRVVVVDPVTEAEPAVRCRRPHGPLDQSCDRVGVNHVLLQIFCLLLLHSLMLR